MKRLLMIMVLAGLASHSIAQTDSVLLVEKPVYIPIMQYWKEHNIFQHLDVSLTAGTTGIGLEVASPVGEYLQVRAGYEYMPHFKKNMSFDLTIDGQPVKAYDADGNRMETKFDKLNEFLYQMTGYEVEDHADMIGKPTINNFKLMADIFPFKNKKWHVTAGFYWGPSKFAEAENSTQAMISLLSVGMYNRMYEKALNNQPLFDFSNVDGLNVEVGVPQEVTDKFVKFGRLGFAVGYYTNDITDADGNVVHQKGERYIVEPAEDGMVRVKAYSNAFKPYLGFGYGGNLLKNSNDWKVSFDCGAMIWGGTPDLYVHDGTNLVKDVENISGQVGTYVSIFKAFKVYPVLSLRLTKTIF